ncbi:hypothetical protein EPN44_09610 [bacterium]|nr:MAG: hypothetical protein EPN44_09610 [bacterium]
MQASAGPLFTWDPERRTWLRAELDVYYARFYGLSRDELRYLLDPVDVYVPDYPSETLMQPGGFLDVSQDVIRRS